MATTPLRRVGRVLTIALALLATIVIAYPIAALLASSLARNPEFVEAAPATGVTIMVETNGIHTGIVVPVSNAMHDWRDTFPSAAMPRQRDGQYPTHLGIGWGEREMFLSVENWSDLKAASVWRIMTSGSDALIRVSPYLRPKPSENYRPLRISNRQYAQLVQTIEASIPKLAPGEFHEVLRGTYSTDAYYEATGTYTVRQTCNSWVGDTLAAAGIKMGAWTPFAGSVLKWIEPPESEVLSPRVRTY